MKFNHAKLILGNWSINLIILHYLVKLNNGFRLEVCVNANILTADERYEQVKQYARHSVTETLRQQCICGDLDRYAMANDLAPHQEKY